MRIAIAGFFRADFDPIAARTLLAVAPGAHPCILRDLDYRKLRPGVRLEPCGPEHRPRQAGSTRGPRAAFRHSLDERESIPPAPTDPCDVPDRKRSAHFEL